MCYLCCSCSIDITTIPQISINLLMPHCSQFVKEESPTAQEKRKKGKNKKRGGEENRIEKETEEESELLISGVSGEGECLL